MIVTTDKSYRNRGHSIPFKEDDPLGGDDPYSASKAAQELVALSFRTSSFEKAGVALATARAGNVIGGGDWALDRLIPDCIRAFAEQKPASIRRPDWVRPWQHVLEPLSGYLLLAEKLYCEPKICSQSYNFAPLLTEAISVKTVAEELAKTWGESASLQVSQNVEGPHEAQVLQLDAALARTELQWQPRWNLRKALKETVDWYKKFYTKQTPAQKLCMDQIEEL